MTKKEKRASRTQKKKNPMNNETTTTDECGLLPRDPMLPTRQQRGQLKGV
jgi:hypothetical protein